MIRSMTAFASGQGARDGASWSWDIRGVNGRGLDLRLRLPEGFAALEQQLRAAMAARVVRGNVTVGLRLIREQGGQAAGVDEAVLGRMLTALELVRARAGERGLPLPEPSTAEVLSLRGVLSMDHGAADPAADEALTAALAEDFAGPLDAFVAMREEEGRALAAIIGGQVDRIADLVEAAAAAAQERAPAVETALLAAIARLREAAPEMDPGRMAQELALIAVKADVTEEIDRLRAHVAAARTLLSEGGAVGRRFDFLAQEFNREANTLCSKAQSQGLTAIGLDLKVVIDQMREQVQNVE